MEEPTGTNVPFKAGDPVNIVGADAQVAVGADRGVVVGDTPGRVTADEVKIVVALDTPAYTNAVIATADLQADT